MDNKQNQLIHISFSNAMTLYIQKPKTLPDVLWQVIQTETDDEASDIFMTPNTKKKFFLLIWKL